MKNEIKRLNENNFKNSKPLLVAKASHLTTGNSVHLLYSNGSIGCPKPVGQCFLTWGKLPFWGNL